MSNEDDVWLFSYGTLRQAGVQRKLFGRELEGYEDRLSGFQVDVVEITDASVIETSGSNCHPILRQSDGNGNVSGSALRLSTADLLIADRYETSDYVRTPVVLESGRRAFVYVGRESVSR